MERVIILLTNGYILSFFLLVMLIELSISNGNHKNNKKVKQNMQKIKDQINGDSPPTE